MKARIEAMDRAGETGEIVFGKGEPRGHVPPRAMPAAPGAAIAAREQEDHSTPGQWFVRKRERDGELLDCFVAAPDFLGLPYDAEILGDDEYRDGKNDDQEDGSGIRRKLADCELIVKAVTFYRTALASRQEAPAASAGVMDAARAVADHFTKYEAKRGEPLRDEFRDPFTQQTRTNGVTIPVPLLRALRAALKP